MHTRGSMIRRAVGGAWLLTLALGALHPVDARPDYLVRFQADPMRRRAVDGCGSCHVKPEGGGARNDFGTAFDAANREITPLLRAAFPQNFDVPTARLADGSTFFLSDPTSRVFVFERDTQKVVVNLAEVTAPKATPLPAAANRMTFFVTSTAAAQGGNVGGLAGADRQCQTLAKAVGAGDLTWRAYLSTSFQGTPATNAGDRIGGGPWFNAAGVLIARGPVDLHTKDRLRPELLLTESAQAVSPLVVFTGTLANGTAAVDQNCGNWTSGGAGGAVAGAPESIWNSGRTASCGPPAAPATPPSHLYCFASR